MTRHPAAAVAVAGVVTAATVAGCGTSLAPRATPNCEDAGRPGSPATVLMAQSVPTASLIPCMRLLPTGWKVSTVYARDGSARFVLSSDRAGSDAVEVHLQTRCDTRGATSVPSDEPGAARYERVHATEPVLRVSRYYTFSGGCTVYEFKLHGEQRAAAANEASLAVGFLPRRDIAARVRRDSHGRLTLDPTAASRP